MCNALYKYWKLEALISGFLKTDPDLISTNNIFCKTRFGFSCQMYFWIFIFSPWELPSLKADFFIPYKSFKRAGMEQCLLSHHQNHNACLIPLQNKQCRLLIKLICLVLFLWYPQWATRLCARPQGWLNSSVQFKQPTGLEAAATKSKCTPSNATVNLQQSPLCFSIKGKLENPWILNPWSADTSADGTAFPTLGIHRDHSSPQQAVTKQQNILPILVQKQWGFSRRLGTTSGFTKVSWPTICSNRKISEKNFSLI